VSVAALASRALGRRYWRLWSASTASALGDGLRRVALPLLAVHLTTDPRQVALVAAAGTVPWLVFGLPVGTLVDRWDRRRTVWVVDLLRTLTVAVLAGAAAAGALSVALLVVVTFVLGTGELFAESAALALVPQLVASSQLERANGRLQAGEVTAGQFAGQGLGGVLYAVALALPFTLDAATFLLSAALVSTLRTPTRRPPTRRRLPAASLRRLPAETAEGLRWLAGHQLLAILCVLLAVLAAVSGAFWAVAALYAASILGLGPTGFGVLLAAGAAGSLAGSLLAEPLAARLGTASAIRLAVALVTLATAGLAATGSPLVAGALLVVNGIAVLVWNVVTVSLRQAIIPDHLLGRVSSAYLFIGLGAQPAGALGAGLLAHAAGLRAVFAVSAALLALTALATAPRLRAGAFTAARDQTQQPAAPPSR